MQLCLWKFFQYRMRSEHKSVPLMEIGLVPSAYRHRIGFQIFNLFHSISLKTFKFPNIFNVSSVPKTWTIFKYRSQMDYEKEHEISRSTDSRLQEAVPQSCHLAGDKEYRYGCGTSVAYQPHHQDLSVTWGMGEFHHLAHSGVVVISSWKSKVGTAHFLGFRNSPHDVEVLNKVSTSFWSSASSSASVISDLSEPPHAYIFRSSAKIANLQVSWGECIWGE